MLKTFQCLSQKVYCDCMLKDVINFVSSRNTCQQTKQVSAFSFSLLEPIIMNFIVSIPIYQGNSVITVAVDIWSNGAHFGCLPTNSSLANVLNYSQT